MTANRECVSQRERVKNVLCNEIYFSNVRSMTPTVIYTGKIKTRFTSFTKNSFGIDDFNNENNKEEMMTGRNSRHRREKEDVRERRRKKKKEEGRDRMVGVWKYDGTLS